MPSVAVLPISLPRYWKKKKTKTQSFRHERRLRGTVFKTWTSILFFFSLNLEEIKFRFNSDTIDICTVSKPEPKPKHDLHLFSLRLTLETTPKSNHNYLIKIWFFASLHVLNLFSFCFTLAIGNFMDCRRGWCQILNHGDLCVVKTCSRISEIESFGVFV